MSNASFRRGGGGGGILLETALERYLVRKILLLQSRLLVRPREPRPFSLSASMRLVPSYTGHGM